MVPTQTEFGLALTQPYKVIHSVLKTRNGRPQPQSDPTDKDVVAHFRSLFSGQDRTCKVPALTPESLQTLLSAAESSDQTEAKLVRWRCMIQDTGFASEVYQSYQLQEHDHNAAESSAAAGIDTAIYSSFGLDFAVEIPPSSSDAEVADSPQSGANASGMQPKGRSPSRRQADSLRERNVMYAVSVPGETSWARGAYGDSAGWPGSDGSYLSDAAEAYLSLSSHDSSRAQSANNPLSNKSPIPEESHVAGLLKFYDVEGVSASLQVTQVVEAVGILESAPFRVDDWQDLGFASPSAPANSRSATSAIYHGPCLHVLFFNPVPPSTIPQALTEARTPSLTGMASAPEIRTGLLKYLKDALGGDELAAEFLLLTLLARVHTRQSGNGALASSGSDVGGTAVGGLSLNLMYVPDIADSKVGDDSIPAPPLPKLQTALRNLLPAVVNQSLSLKHLNDAEVTFSPRVAADESLQAGRLQLPKGTTLVVDEVGMGEGGTLREGGVKNVQSLAGVLKHSRLEYQYPYHSFSFEADLRIIILSSGKSFLPVDLHVPLEHDTQKTSKTELPSVTPDTWRLYRLFLLQARHASFTIDEKDGVADRISADFVAARKKHASSSATAKAGETAEGDGMATQEDLLRRMNIARLLALSKSEAKLTIDTWTRAGELDEARLERLRRLPLGRPAQNPVPL